MSRWQKRTVIKISFGAYLQCAHSLSRPCRPQRSHRSFRNDDDRAFGFRRTITGRRVPDASFIPLPASRCLKPKARTKAGRFHISAAARKSRVNSRRYARARKVILRRVCAIANIGSPCYYCLRCVYVRATDYVPSSVFILLSFFFNTASRCIYRYIGRISIAIS